MKWLKKIFKNNDCDCDKYCGSGTFENVTQFCVTKQRHLMTCSLPKPIPAPPKMDGQ